MTEPLARSLKQRVLLLDENLPDAWKAAWQKMLMNREAPLGEIDAQTWNFHSTASIHEQRGIAVFWCPNSGPAEIASAVREFSQKHPTWRCVVAGYLSSMERELLLQLGVSVFAETPKSTETSKQITRRVFVD